MHKRDSLIYTLERFFWVFLFINPFLDILNGVYLKVVAGVEILEVETAVIGVTPSLVIRMLVLLVFLAYIFLVWDKKAILTFIPIGIAWVLSVVSEFLYLGKISLFTDIQYITRFCYNILIMFVYARIFSKRWGQDKQSLLDKIDLLIAYTLIVLTFSILLSYVMGIGYNTYADRLGYRGARGFFYAGNDITAILVLLMPLSMAKFMQMDRRKVGIGRLLLYVLPSAMAANSLIIIGSKTAFMAVGFTYAAMFVIALVFLLRDKNVHALLGAVWALLAMLAVFFILMLLCGMDLVENIKSSFFATGQIVEQEGEVAAIMSGRQFKLSEHITMYKDGGVLVWLFGMGRGSHPIILEMDLLEILFYYGLFGALTMLWIYAKLGLGFLWNAFRKLDPTKLALTLSLALCTGYLIMAGHVLFSVTSGFYYGLTIVYSRLYLAEKPEQVPILKV